MRLPWVPVLLLVLAAGCSSSPQNEDSGNDPGDGVHPVDCSGHRHATFAVAVPDAEGELQRLDLAAPRSSSGQAYYQLGVAPSMTVAAHMHQTGHEAGTPEEQVSQMHYESAEHCVTVAESLAAIDVTATADKLTVAGQHAAKGSWSNDGSNVVRVYLQQPTPIDDACIWGWQPVDAATGLRHVVANGESFLVLHGDPAPGDASALQSAIPPPVGRPSPDCS